MHAVDGDEQRKCVLVKHTGDETVVLLVPVGGGGGLHACAVVLHYYARYSVLEWLVQLREVLNAGVDDLLAPLVHLILLVCHILVSLHYHLNGFRGNLFDLVVIEFFLVFVIHF